jgi:hypothetical protein
MSSQVGTCGGYILDLEAHLSQPSVSALVYIVPVTETSSIEYS